MIESTELKMENHMKYKYNLTEENTYKDWKTVRNICDKESLQKYQSNRNKGVHETKDHNARVMR